MEQISQKTTAMLLDELITTVIKLNHFSSAPLPDAEAVKRLAARKELLIAALDQKLVGACTSAGPSAQLGGPKRPSGIGQLFSELAQTLLSCWNAQEQVMGSDDPAVVTPAAKDAQRLNARRNALIRSIDQALGEGTVSATEKTYG